MNLEGDDRSAPPAAPVTIGIIANPASGKDIRRLVSRATTVNNHEKVSIVQRVLLALDANGADRIRIMPDPFGIGRRALSGLRDASGLLEKASLIDMPFQGSARDSVIAAQQLQEVGAGCVVVLGGDGTCRAVAKGCGDMPIVPLSTGTNNVVPSFVGGTVAGAAAVYVAGISPEDRGTVCDRHKRLLVIVNGERVDQALVEVAVVRSGFVGARAIWEADRLVQLFVTRAQPSTIGLSSIIGVVRPLEPGAPLGAAASFSADGRQVMAPLAPGTFARVSLDRIRDLEPGIRVPVDGARPVAMGLDGERELVLVEGDDAEVVLDPGGPWIVDVERALKGAVESGQFLRTEAGD